MAKTTGSNETFMSNYPTAPDGTVRTDAPVKKHPLASGTAAGAGILSTAVAVGGASVNIDGVGTRSDKKIS